MLLVFRQKSQEPSFWEVMDCFVLFAYANLAGSRILLQQFLACLNFTLDSKDLFCFYKVSKVVWKRKIITDFTRFVKFTRLCGSNLSEEEKIAEESVRKKFIYKEMAMKEYHWTTKGMTLKNFTKVVKSFLFT